MNFKVTGDCFLEFVPSRQNAGVYWEQRIKCGLSPNNISMLAESQRLLQFLKLIWASKKVWYWGCCCCDWVFHDKWKSRQIKLIRPVQNVWWSQRSEFLDLSFIVTWSLRIKQAQAEPAGSHHKDKPEVSTSLNVSSYSYKWPMRRFFSVRCISQARDTASQSLWRTFSPCFVARYLKI